MFHIGVATQHPPLPDPGQLSDMGIDFIRQCLTIDPVQRPTANELMNHPWMLDFREKRRSYEEEGVDAAAGGAPEDPTTATAAAVVAPAPSAATDAAFDGASVARQAAIMQEKETELIQAASPTMSPLATPEGSHEGSSPGLRVDRDPLSSSSEGGETSSSGSGSS